RTNTATISCPASSSSSWQRLVSILDSRPKQSGEQTSIVPLLRADPSTIRRAATLLSQYFSGSADPHRKLHIGQFVSMLFQQAAFAQVAAQPAGGAQPPPPPAPPLGAPLPAPAAPGLETAAQPPTPGPP